MTPQEFNTMDKMLGNNPVEKLSKQATESIDQMKNQNIQMPAMPKSYTPFMQTPVPEHSYLLAVNGQQTGPYTVAQIQQMLSQGSITVESLVWRSGMMDWTPIKNVPGLF